MSAKIVSYYEYDNQDQVTCPACGWSGRCHDQEDIHSEVLDVCCGSCDKMILIIPFPTHEETRAASSAGNKKAMANLGHVEEVEAFRARASEHELTQASDLPDLKGDDLVILWDFESHEDESGRDSWTILRHGDEVIWREIAYYDGYHRFREVFNLLLERYGNRFAELRPTQASSTYLYGDSISSGRIVDGLNEDQAKRRASGSS